MYVSIKKNEPYFAVPSSQRFSPNGQEGSL